MISGVHYLTSYRTRRHQKQTHFMNRGLSGTRHAGQVHLTCQAPELIVPVEAPLVTHRTKLSADRWDLTWHYISHSPRKAVTTLGITGGWACCPPQAVEQIALGASPAGSYARVAAKLSFLTRNADTLPTISKTAILRMKKGLGISSCEKKEEAAAKMIYHATHLRELLPGAAHWTRDTSAIWVEEPCLIAAKPGFHQLVMGYIQNVNY